MSHGIEFPITFAAPCPDYYQVLTLDEINLPERKRHACPIPVDVLRIIHALLEGDQQLPPPPAIETENAWTFCGFPIEGPTLHFLGPDDIACGGVAEMFGGGDE